jgi:hypothetical protein
MRRLGWFSGIALGMAALRGGASTSQLSQITVLQPIGAGIQLLSCRPAGRTNGDFRTEADRCEG